MCHWYSQLCPHQVARWETEAGQSIGNRTTISDNFAFSDWEIQNLVIDENDSFDVTSLFTKYVPLQEPIENIAEKALLDNWVNVTHNLNITKPDLVQLLEVITTNQLFQFDGKLYEQIDGVAMGSPLGPLMGNAFLCYIEEKIDQDSKLPEFYRRWIYVCYISPWKMYFSSPPSMQITANTLFCLRSTHAERKMFRERYNVLHNFE